jgi:hypothetical protein
MVGVGAVHDWAAPLIGFHGLGASGEGVELRGQLGFSHLSDGSTHRGGLVASGQDFFRKSLEIAKKKTKKTVAFSYNGGRERAELLSARS